MNCWCAPLRKYLVLNCTILSKKRTHLLAHRNILRSRHALCRAQHTLSHRYLRLNGGNAPTYAVEKLIGVHTLNQCRSTLIYHTKQRQSLKNETLRLAPITEPRVHQALHTDHGNTIIDQHALAHPRPV